MASVPTSHRTQRLKPRSQPNPRSGWIPNAEESILTLKDSESPAASGPEFGNLLRAKPRA